MAQKLNQKELEFFNKANKQPYGTQARLFLNAFWDDMGKSAEEVYQFHHKYIATDLFLKGVTPPSPSKEGVDLDEHGFHVFLERNIKPMTVIDARQKLKEADVSFDGKVSLLEFLNWHYKKFAQDFIKRAPADPSEVTQMSPELQKATSALNAARNEIQKIEDEKNRLETESELTGIKGGKAKNELKQLLTRDNTELNKMLLTAEAAVRKLGGSGVDVPPGSLWWMNREIEEMKKYKPKGK